MTDVTYEKRGAVAHVVLATDKLNTYTNRTLLDLQDVWRDFADDDALRVAILSGAGENFCGGHNLKVAEEEPVSTEPAAIHYGDLQVLKPIVGAVRGYALGGGCSMALACDILVLSETATLGYPQARPGLISIGGPQRLPRLIPGLAQWYLFSGEVMDAAEAYRLGLCLRVVPDATLLDAAGALAETLCRSSPDSIRALKESIEAGRTLNLDEAFKVSKQIAARYEATPAYRDNLRAFLDRTVPPFRPR